MRKSDLFGSRLRALFLFPVFSRVSIGERGFAKSMWYPSKRICGEKICEKNFPRDEKLVEMKESAQIFKSRHESQQVMSLERRVQFC